MISVASIHASKSYRLTNLVIAILLTASSALAQATLTNDSVIQMHSKGWPEQGIIHAIQHYPGQYSLAPSDLTNLKAHGVSDQVIAAMQAAASGRQEVDTSATPPAPRQKPRPRLLRAPDQWRPGQRQISMTT